MAGKGDYVVYDTDYDTYAAIYECQQLSSLMHRKSASILSRTPSLDQTFVNRVRINRIVISSKKMVEAVLVNSFKLIMILSKGPENNVQMPIIIGQLSVMNFDQHY